MPRTLLVVLPLLVAVAVGVNWLAHRPPPAAPGTSAAGLATLPDAWLENHVLSGLAQHLARIGSDGVTGGAWRGLPLPAANLWALALVEQRFNEDRGGTVLATPRDEGPGLADARGACVAMGLASGVAALDALAAHAARHPTGGEGTQDPLLAELGGRLRRALEEPANRERRVRYLRAHLDELAQP